MTAVPLDECPAISVVLPVLNEARDIGRLLQELREQIAPPGGFEVLVVDGGSTDPTRRIVSSFQDDRMPLRLLANPRKLSSAGRNVGARAARGKYVLFLDGHCSVPRRDYLVRAVALFESTGAECLCRPQPLERLASGGWARAISAARHSRLGHNPGSDIFGAEPSVADPRSAGAAYLRTLFARIGGYDERFDACEDVEFNQRVAEAGLLSYRHPDLSIDYRPRSSLGSLLRQMFRYGRGRARLMARHPRALPGPLLLVTALLLSLVPLALAAGLKASGIAAAGLLALWCLPAAAESLRLGGLTRQAPRILLAFAAIHLGLLAGFWRGLPEFPRFRPEPAVERRESGAVGAE